jgi:myo-inositol-hexaphosphate 3-phosphohydrolase
VDNVFVFPIPFRFAATGAAALSLAGLTAVPGLAQGPTHTATAIVETQPADATGDTVDDAAIWVNPTDAAASLVIGSNHKESTVEVYDLYGKRLQRLETRGTNNIDSRPGFPLGGGQVDLVGVAGGGTRSGRMTFSALTQAHGP